MLIERGHLTVEQLNAALERAAAAAAGKLLGEILVERGFCTEDQVIECLAAEYGVPYAKLEPRLADPEDRRRACRASTSRRTSSFRCSRSATC